MSAGMVLGIHRVKQVNFNAKLEDPLRKMKKASTASESVTSDRLRLDTRRE
jgi:hypothetical protein